MSVTVLVELDVSADRLDDVTPLFETLLGGTRARQGNEGVTVHVDQDTPTRIVLIERWATREHYTAYNDWQAGRGDLTTLAQLLTEPPQRRFLDHLPL